MTAQTTPIKKTRDIIHDTAFLNAGAIIPGGMPKDLLNDLTQNERRDLMGLPALPTGKFNQLGTDGSQILLSIMERFSTGKMSELQAQGAMKILFGFNDIEVKSLTAKK